MPDNKKLSGRAAVLFRRRLRHRGRAGQIPIFLGKFFRMFIYQNDWKVLPMAALIAGLLAYVIRTDFMRTMEGTLKGAFAITCVALWNGCFNSIQVICRERDIIKREHRSGMHISSYIIAHMLYQAFLCFGQTVLMLYVFRMVGMRFPSDGLFSKWFRVDLGITIFLVTFAADMLALLISAVVRSTTGAMTVMPFILIFQLVFSGGIFALPSWTEPLTEITISNHGLTCIASQADYNNLPMATAWNTLKKMRNTDIEGSVTMDELLELFSEDTAQRSRLIRDFRNIRADELKNGASSVTMGELLDLAAADENLDELRSREWTGSISIGEIIDIFGEDKVKESVSRQAAAASQNDRYERSKNNIGLEWAILGVSALLYALAAMIALEFVDHDRR